MNDRTPPGFPLMDGVFSEAAITRMVLTLMDPELRRYRANGVNFDPRVSLYIRALEAKAKQYAGESPLSPRPTVRWVSTSHAAKILGVSTETVRNMAEDGRLPWRRDGRKLYVEAGHVADLAKLRGAA